MAKNVKKQNQKQTQQTPKFKAHGKNFQPKQKKVKVEVVDSTETLTKEILTNMDNREALEKVVYDPKKAVQDIIAKYKNKK